MLLQTVLHSLSLELEVEHHSPNLCHRTDNCATEFGISFFIEEAS
jgi:hypothetical protein